MSKFLRALASVVTACAALQSIPAASQVYPNRPVKIVVGVAAGGVGDNTARAIGQALAERLNQPFVVENKLGAGGTIAAELVAKSPPDGYTLLLTEPGMQTIAPALYAKLGYDPAKDFVPLSHSVATPMILIAAPSIPVNDLRGFIALAKAQPGRLNYGSPGSGIITHLAFELFKSMAGIDVVHVPYKGMAPAMADLMAGQVQVMLVSVSTALQQIRAGKVKVLGVASSSRLPSLPDVPTLSESGLPGYVLEPWIGFVAPAGTPKPVVDLLEKEFAAVLTLPAVRERLMNLGVEVIGAHGDGLTKAIQVDLGRWPRIVKELGLRAE
jgi:tripartite-type tricarboxylate transporter receptor subunit TctC